MKTHVLIAGAASVAMIAAGYGLAIAPQRDAIEETRTAVDDARSSNETVEARIPKLKAELEGITPQIDSLRDLSKRVPATIDLPTLYADLDAASAAAGVGRVENVTVSVPQLVTPEAPAAAAPVEGEATQTEGAAEESAGPAAQPMSVIASYTVAMSIKGSPDQVVAFLQALSQSSRLNVVSSTSMTGGENSGAQISATFFLQQVDVEQIATQIEELAVKGSVAVEPPADAADPAAVPELPSVPTVE